MYQRIMEPLFFNSIHDLFLNECMFECMRIYDLPLLWMHLWMHDVFFNVWQVWLFHWGMNAWLYADAWNSDSHEIFFFTFNAWRFWFAILLLSLNQIFLWNHWIHWLNFELSFWEQRSQILTLGTKLLIRSILTFDANVSERVDEQTYGDDMLNFK